MRSSRGSCVLAFLVLSIRSRTWRRCSKVVFVCFLWGLVEGQQSMLHGRLRPRAGVICDGVTPGSGAFGGGCEAGGSGRGALDVLRGVRGVQCRGGAKQRESLQAVPFAAFSHCLGAARPVSQSASTQTFYTQTWSTNTRAAAIKFAGQRAVKALKTLTRSAHGSRG